MSSDIPSNMKKAKLAIVLLDIIGSTAYVQKYGALRAAKLFQYHDRLARNLIYKYDGREIDRSDGFLCSFQRPIDAINFALHYQREIPVKTYLNSRIGIHWDTIIEVKQEDIYIEANAKKIELEGLAKNIAARTMSLCQAKQVLLTKEAMEAVRGRTNRYTPKGTLYASAGLYQFKGVSEPKQIYMVSEDADRLIPPKGNEKAKRIGGSKQIKIRARNKKLKHWIVYFYYRIGFISILYLLYNILMFLSYPEFRRFFGLYEEFVWYDLTIQYIKESWEFVLNSL